MIFLFWIQFTFIFIWGFFFIHVAYLIAVKKIRAPFDRFSRHMHDIANQKKKDFFIHRESDHHMKDIVGSFNTMIDNLFDEIEYREKIIEVLRENIKEIHNNPEILKTKKTEELLGYKEFHQ